MKQTLLALLANGPFKGTLALTLDDEESLDTWTGLIEAVPPVSPATETTHIRITNGRGDATVISLDDLERGDASLHTTSHPHTATPADVTAERDRIYAAINRILDTYDDSEDDDEIGECAPEDRWRLYRDLRALTGITE